MCIRDRTQTGQTEDGFAINRYFIDHPEMVLGRQEPVSTCLLYTSGNTDRQRERVVAAFEKQKTTAEIAEIRCV